MKYTKNLSSCILHVMKKSNNLFAEEFTLTVYSDKWTSEMEFVYLISQKLKINFLWLRPILKYRDQLPIKYKLRSEDTKNKFKIHTEFIKDWYSTPVMFNMLSKNVDKNTWVFRLDHDEIISEDSLKILLKSLPLLNRSFAYGIPRLWINKFDKSWFYSSVAATHSKKYDFINRLFTMRSAAPSTHVHNGGVKQNKTREFEFDCFILHLIYLRENLESRIKKIVNYETLEPGSGHSKIRHYFPEIYPDTIWKLLPDSEIKLIRLFESSNKLF